MRLALAGRHGQQALGVHQRRQLLGHVGTQALQHQPRQLGGQALEVGVVQALAGIAGGLQFMQRGQRAQALVVEPADDGLHQGRLFGQRGAAQHQRLGRDQLAPVGVAQAQTLRLVDDDQVGRPLRQVRGVAVQRLGRQNAHPRGAGPQRLALVQATGHQLRRLAIGRAGKTQPGPAPGRALVGRAQHQHPLHAEVALPQAGGGDGLHALAQATFVGDQRPARDHREQRALGLKQRQR